MSPDDEGRPPESAAGTTPPVTRARRLASLASLAGHLGERRLKALVPVVVLVAAVLIAMLMVASRSSIVAIPAVERAWPVSAVGVAYETVQPELRLYGQVTAGREVDLRALVGGEIVETWPEFQDGGIVRKGQPLLRIDPFNYESAMAEIEANLHEARARLVEFQVRLRQEENAMRRSTEQVKLVRRDLLRSEQLAERGTISEKLLDDKRLAASQQELAVETRGSNLDIEKARIEQQEAAVERLGVHLARAQRDLGNTLLVAPFDGFVLAIGAAVGRLINVNDRVATIVDSDHLEVRFTLSNAQYGRIINAEGQVTGREVEVLWRVGDRALEYEAVVDRITANIASATGGVEVYARLDVGNIETPLRPGAFVEIRVPDRAYRNVARLPGTAVSEERIVYAITDGRLEEREVRVAGYDEGFALVEGDLREGEQVLQVHFTEAGPGVKVEVLQAP